jgi:hypothetical protein
LSYEPFAASRSYKADVIVMTCRSGSTAKTSLLNRWC